MNQSSVTETGRDLSNISFEYLRREISSKLDLDSHLGPILTPEEIGAYSLKGAPNTVITRALESVVYYLKGFLCQPHPHLGRDGPVCPFTEKGMQKGLIQLSVFLGEPTMEGIEKAVTELSEQFELKALKAGKEKMYLSLIIVFPEMVESEFPLIDASQSTLKDQLVTKGLMAGQFHYFCDEAGVCNSDFLPLRSPIPLLAIRHMTPGDVVFLLESSEHLKEYCKRFGRSKVPKTLLEKYDDAMKKYNLTEIEEKLI